MSDNTSQKPTRRGFLGTAVALIGAPLVAPRLCAAAPVEAAAKASVSSAPSGYRSLTPDEAAFTESMVNALCPADRMTPDGTTCGLATFIDRQIDGEFGRGHAHAAWEHGQEQDYAQLPLTQEQFFKAGIARVDAVARTRFGWRFSQLDAPTAAELLREIGAGRVVDSELPLAAWFNQVVNPLLVQASFAGSVYDEHLGKVFWKLFVSPVVPA